MDTSISKSVLQNNIVKVLLIAVFISICTLATNLEESHAAEVVHSGMCGDDIRWALDEEGTMTISGSGEIWEYLETANSTPWYQYRNELKKCIIESGVTSMGYCAFYGCSRLESITIPSSVTSIGAATFRGCSSLVSVTIPSRVTDIGDHTFYGCSSLESITIPSRVTDIGDSAFYGCSSLKILSMPIDVAFSQNSFDGVVNIEKVTLTYGTTGNGREYTSTYQYTPWYKSKDKVTKIVISNSVKSIGSCTFYGCSSLENITIPSSVMGIGRSAFRGCSSLKSITIPNGIGTIERFTFYGCSSLESVTIPSSVATIEWSAFYGCSSLESVTIPSSVEDIGDSAFYGCGNLESITLPDSVTNIGESAFYGCSGLKILSMPIDVALSQNSFDGVVNIEEVTLTSGTTGKCKNYTGTSCQYTPWYRSKNKLATVVISVGVENIGNYAFYECSNLQSITITSSVTSIGSSAFYGCNSLQSITIPNKVTSIGGSALYGCSGLKILSMPIDVAFSQNSFDGVVNIEKVTLTKGTTGNGTNYTSSSCRYTPWYRSKNKITTVVISNGVKSTGDYAFYGCNSLESITIPSSVTSIGSSAFYGCNSLESITIPSNVTSIGSYTFYGCGSLQSITIPNKVTTIGEAAFKGCSNLQSITIPNKVTSIGGSALYGCSGLKILSMPIDVVFSQNSFDGVVNIEKVTLTSGTTGIGTNYTSSSYQYTPWYKSKNKVTTVDISTGVGSIGDYAFYEFSNLQSIVISTSVTNIGDYAFCGCSGLKILSMPIDVAFSQNSFDGVVNIEKVTLTKGATGNGTNYTSSSCRYTPWYRSKNKLTTIVVSYGVKSIGYCTFFGCSSIESVTISEGVKSIGSSAFYGCNSLESITIPNSVTSIAYAFYGCSGLKSITIPSSMTSIGPGAFEGCRCLTSVTIPDSVTSIGEAAFKGCSRLMEVTMPIDVVLTYFDIDSAEYEHSDSFDGVNIKKVRLTQGTTGQGVDYNDWSWDANGYQHTPWYKSDNKVTVDISDDVTRIGNNAFRGCSNLVDITIPDSVTSIGTNAFRGCTGLIQIAGLKSKTYTGKAIVQKPKVTLGIFHSDGSRYDTGKYDVAYKNNINVGVATVIVRNIQGFNGKIKGLSRKGTFKITKAKNTLTAKGKTATIKYVNVKKKAQSVKRTKVLAVNKAQGTVTYTKINGNKKILINKKTGKVKVKKGLKKGKYRVKVKVKATGNRNYKSIIKPVTFKIQVK